MDTKAWLLAVIEHQRRETERLEREDAERTIAEVKPLIEQNLRDREPLE